MSEAVRCVRYGENFVENVPGCQLLCMARAECTGFELRPFLRMPR